MAVSSLDGLRCSICLEGIENLKKSRVLHAKEYRGHRFHRHCINEWLTIENSCPICKRVVTDLPLAETKVKAIAALVSYMPSLVLPFQGSFVANCINQDLPSVQDYMRSHSYDINVGSLCLLISCINPNKLIVLEILKDETHIEYRSQALVEVVKKNNLELAQILIDSGVTEYGWAKSLFYAEERGFSEMLDLLMRFGRDKPDYKGYGLVEFDYCRPLAELFHYLSNDESISAEVRGKALIKALRARHYGAVHFFMNLGVELDAEERSEVVFWLMRVERFELAERVLDMGEVSTSYSGEILVYGCKNKRLRIIQLILQRGAISSTARSKALLEIVKADILKDDKKLAHQIVVALIDSGEINNDEKILALLNLLYFGMEDTFEILLPLVNLSDEFQIKLFMLAAKLGHQKVGLSMLRQFHIEDSWRKKAAMRAASFGHDQFIDAMMRESNDGYMFQATIAFINYIYRYSKKSWQERIELAMLQTMFLIAGMILFSTISKSVNQNSDQ